ncbi:programmed cell death protein 10-A isoform X1 [Dermatophagoides farinae]|uniref:Programmed cell death protein 10 n=3 Tax=Dermatophagoides farinae TaxID=6954 RepID=A0A922HR36_DERFA|nr:Programmed cell death protein 10 [Dermatophagoides farinae]
MNKIVSSEPSSSSSSSSTVSNHHHHHYQQQQQSPQIYRNNNTNNNNMIVHHHSGVLHHSSSSSSPNHTNNNNSEQSSSSIQSTTVTQYPRYPSVTAALIWPIIVRPLLCKIQKHSQQAAVVLLKALGKCEHRRPGFLLEFITEILATRNIISMNMTEALLRMQSQIPEFEEQRCRRQEEPFQELNRRTFALKKILSRIPDVLYDRQVFLETIRKIASAIKKLLDCVNDITGSNGSSSSGSGFIQTYQDKRSVDQRKREFIKDSKNFSQTLKEYFKHGDGGAVLQSAAQLILATNAIQKTIKICCDPRDQTSSAIQHLNSK